MRTIANLGRLPGVNADLSAGRGPAVARAGLVLGGRYRLDEPIGAGGMAVVWQAWDAVLIVRYPSRQAFSDMVADPEYQQVTRLRTEALTEAVLQATLPW